MRWIPRVRYSLAALLAAVTVLCLWLGTVTRRVREEKRSIEILERAGAIVYPDYLYDARTDELFILEEPSAPRWMRQLFGDEYFCHAVYAYLQQGQAYGEDQLQAIGALYGLQRLDLYFTPTTNSDLSRLAGLNKLFELDLQGTEVTDEGLSHIAGLRSLEVLNLDDTKVNGAGIRYLRRLRLLRELRLRETKINDDGLAAIAELQQLKALYLDSAPITSDGLRHLAEMRSLESLSLRNTATDDAGLENLRRLTRLRELELKKTRVHEPAVKRLKEALPQCEVDWEAPWKPKQTSANPGDLSRGRIDRAGEAE